ncbi:response regulator [Anoxybacterium hadale]|uniref:Response regulator n=1 Tax=Anoxybacterium hadale TaxID=3408580 RepID=A0ACD1AEN5_9FIRM|nr:response regulator [Clostridiales bacterium]
MKILYVEDETEAREALSKYLKRHAGKIFTAADGLEGLKLFEEQLPDLVIVDLYMPKMDGLEMIREIKKISHEVYVIITTAVDDVDIILRSVDIGINKYLLKPIDPVELMGAIDEYAVILAQKQKTEILFTVEEKKQLEDKIKKEFTSFLKTATGKGPSGVAVFIDNDTIEITAYDALTVMEKNLLDNCQNSIIIEQYRKLFYSANENPICDLIHEIIGSRVKFQQVEVSMENKTNKIELQIVR